MPTSHTAAESRTHVTLPDIFRTINGNTLDIGPNDRMRVVNGDGAVKVDDDEKKGRCTHPRPPASYPRIVLRDALGYELDTFTTLQESIYRAKWLVKQTGQAKTPIEWRLPKAPAPARPDLSRSFPPPKHPPSIPRIDRDQYNNVRSNVLEFDVEDVGFVRESLELLPFAPSLSFLRQEFLVGPKTYFQIVGTMLLHKRFLSQTEKRDALYNFPGFCTGCTRLGLCYGCEKGTEPHYHEDKPVRTGGGYTYFKKDRPEKQMKSRNPINWKIKHPDQALKQLLEEYTGVGLEGEIPEEVKKLLDEHGGHLERNVTGKPNNQRLTIPNFAEEMAKFSRQQQKKQMAGDGNDASDEESDDNSTSEDKVKGQGQRKVKDHKLPYGDAEGQMSGDEGDFSQRQGELDSYHTNEGQHGRFEGHQGQTGRRFTMRDEFDPIDASTTISSDGVTLKTRSSHKSQGHHDPICHYGDEMLDSNSEDNRRRVSKKRETSHDKDDPHSRRAKTDTSGAEGEDGDDETNSLHSKQTSRGRQRERLYKPPPPFKLKKSPSRKIVSKSPFSTERSYDIPKGGTFEVKKSDKPPTKFKDFKNVDVSWKEPKKFELKKGEQKTTKFWSGPPKSKSEERRKVSKSRSRSPGSRKLRRVPSPPPMSPDSGLESAVHTESNRSELEPLREETPSSDLSKDMERLGTPSTIRIPTPERPLQVISPQPPSQPPPKKREIVKKEKKVKPVSPALPPPPKAPTPVKERTPTPDLFEESLPSREISFDIARQPSLPDLPPIEVPELPTYQEKEKSEYKGTKKERKLIEVTPELPPEKKKLKGPPKLGPRITPQSQPRRSKVAEAPVTNQELQQLKDPLDFLAKYCIINPERLPYYERVFNGAISVQTPRYSREREPVRNGAMVHLPPAQLSAHEIKMLRDMTVVAHAQSPRKEGISAPEQYLEKLNYSLEFIKGKQELITNHMQDVQGEKIRLMAAMAREMDRDIVRLDYKTKAKKKKKKKKKKKGEVPDFDTLGAMGANFRPTKASDITDEVIVSRMDDKMLKKAKKDPVIKRLSLEVSRDIEKLKNYDKRVAEIEDEKDLVGLYCMDYYFSEQVNSTRPQEFRRQQSRLYQKLHPDPDVEMNIEEVEAALQQINNKLLTDREFQYIYFILDLPKREKINFRLFTIIAAMSEKVTQMDPVIRKLLNKVDYNALDVKMDKSKELFELLHDEDFLPSGNAPADNLAVELTAGGLTPEHTSYVMSKFNREGTGMIDFLDFVTYVPLFIEIHRRIIEDPFNETLNV